MVKFRHHDPICPAGPGSTSRLSTYRLQVLFAPSPPNAVVKVPVPVGAAVAKLDEAGPGKVSKLSEPMSIQLSVGKQVVQGGAVSSGIWDVPSSEMTSEP